MCWIVSDFQEGKTATAPSLDPRGDSRIVCCVSNHNRIANGSVCRTTAAAIARERYILRRERNLPWAGCSYSSVVAVVQSMSNDPLADPVRHALNSVHRHLAIGRASARRYPRGVAPLAAIDDTSEPTLANLRALLSPGEQVYIFNEPPGRMNGLAVGSPLVSRQMVGPEIFLASETSLIRASRLLPSAHV